MMVDVTGYKMTDEDPAMLIEVGKTYGWGKEFVSPYRVAYKIPFSRDEPFKVFLDQSHPIINKKGDVAKFYQVSAKECVVGVDRYAVDADELTFVKELSLEEFIKSQVDYIVSQTAGEVNKNDHNIRIIYSGDKSCARITSNDIENVPYDIAYISTSGKGSDYISTDMIGISVNTSGIKSFIVSTHDRVNLTSTAYQAVLISTGMSAALTSTMEKSKILATGIYARLTAIGSGSQLIATGNSSVLTAEGVDCRLVATGEDSILNSGSSGFCVALGKNNVINMRGSYARFKGVNGTLVNVMDYASQYDHLQRHYLSEEASLRDEYGQLSNSKCLGFITGRIGENGLKENTAYTIKNGEFVEVSETF